MFRFESGVSNKLYPMFRFESGVSNKLYEKLMGKYESCPDDPMDKFSKGSLIQKLIFYRN